MNKQDKEKEILYDITKNFKNISEDVDIKSFLAGYYSKCKSYKNINKNEIMKGIAIYSVAFGKENKEERRNERKNIIIEFKKHLADDLDEKIGWLSKRKGNSEYEEAYNDFVGRLKNKLDTFK